MLVIPTRGDIEQLIRLCCLPETAGRARWQKVAFPFDVAMRQCEAESSFRHCDPTGQVVTCSSAGALGLFQLMPATAKDMKVDPRDWRQNVHGGIKYDKILYVRYSGDLGKVLAAYNWGIGRLDEAIRERGEPGWKKALPAETIKYVKRVLNVKSGAHAGVPKTAPAENPSGAAPAVA